MSLVLWLLGLLAVLGALDTLYYHEWRARLPALGKNVAKELYLHSVRDFLYAILFGTLPWLGWHGWWAMLLAIIVILEIVFTLWDFVIEATVRKQLGDVYAGERVMHALLGIIYGSLIASLIPVMWDWWFLPTQLEMESPDVPGWLNKFLMIMAFGVLASGLRDLYAALGLPYGHWPWKKIS